MQKQIEERYALAKILAENFTPMAFGEHGELLTYDESDFEWCAFQAIEAGYRKQEWISVEERLPECEIGAETEALLFMTSEGRVEAGYFGRGSVWRDVYFRHYRTCVGRDVSDVTHWMPLPSAPK